MLFKSQSVGPKSVLVLRRKAKELKHRRSEGLNYVFRAEIIKSELLDACENSIPDDALVHYILDGLSKAYAMFVH